MSLNVLTNATVSNESQPPEQQQPRAILFVPIFATLDPNSEIVAFVAAVLSFDNYLTNLLPRA